MNLDDVLKQPEAVEVDQMDDEDNEEIGRNGSYDQLDPKGEEVPATPAATPTVPPVVPDSSESISAFKKAALDEREKRQKLEKQLQELERRLQPQPTAEEKQTFFDDPDKYVSKLREEMKNEILENRMDISEDIARNKHEDFQEKLEKFGEMLRSIPGLREQWLVDRNPAEFAYQQAKQRMEFESVGGSLETFKSKLEADLRAKIEAELTASFQEKAKIKAKLPASISDAGSASPRAAAFKGPTPLGTVLKRKK